MFKYPDWKICIFCYEVTLIIWGVFGTVPERLNDYMTAWTTVFNRIRAISWYLECSMYALISQAVISGQDKVGKIGSLK